MYTYYTKVSNIVDGDTVDVFVDLGFKVWRQERMRLVGVDTAEKNTPVLYPGFSIKDRSKASQILYVKESTSFMILRSVIFIKNSIISICLKYIICYINNVIIARI